MSAAPGARGHACAVGPPASPARSVLRHVQLENLAAGLSGGVVSTLVLHPLDLVKIRFAVSDGLELRPKYNGILHCMTTVWKREGLRGLYQGVTPNMVGAGASWGLYFFFYNAIKAYKKEGKLESLTATEHLVSAAEAGAMTLCITNPIWVTKTRLVLQYDAGVDPSKRQYAGMSDALIKIYRTEGIRGLYKAITSRCIHQSLEGVKKPISVQAGSSLSCSATEQEHYLSGIVLMTVHQLLFAVKNIG